MLNYSIINLTGEVQALLTVFRILFGKNVKLGNGLADKGSSLSFFMLYNHIKIVIGAFPLCQVNYKVMT